MKIVKEFLEEVDLHEVSVVGPPAYPRAIVKSFNKQVMGETMQKDEIGAEASEEETKTSTKVDETANADKPETKTETKTEDVKVEDKTSDKKSKGDKDSDDDADKDGAIEEKSKAVLEKTVDERVEKYVKSKSFDKLVEERVEKIMSRRAETEDTKKFPEKEKKLEDEDVGRLGAKFVSSD